MPDYSNGKIYKIVDNTNANIYIGSTCEPTLARRLSKHVGDYKCWKNGKKNNKSSFKIIENGDYDIVLIENFPCDKKDELHKRERYWIETLDCINLNIPFREPKESDKIKYEKFKDKIKARAKKWAEDNKERVKQLHSERYQSNKEQIEARRKTKYTCVCGSFICSGEKSEHEKSKKHQNFINSMKET